MRAEAAYADASQRLVVGAPRSRRRRRAERTKLQVETLRLTQLAEQTRARSEQIAGDLAEVDAQLEDLQERRVTAEGRFEELDMQLADSQERHAQLDERVIEAERKLLGVPRAAAQSGAPGAGGCFRPAQPCGAPGRTGTCD